jgi:hypothetical protein
MDREIDTAQRPDAGKRFGHPAHLEDRVVHGASRRTRPS